MKMMMSRCRVYGLALALIGLVILHGLVYAGPCYIRTGTPSGCYSQGGSACVCINPIPTLACPGGPWPYVDLYDPTAPCRVYDVEKTLPQNGATDGNQSSGYMNQGYYQFLCSTQQSCTKHVTVLPPIVITCTANNPIPCTFFTIFTAGGAACPDE